MLYWHEVEWDSDVTWKRSSALGGTLILLGEAAQLLQTPLPCGYKDSRIFSPNSIPSSTPHAKRGELPQGWHGFRFLLRGYWVAWAGTRVVWAR